MGSSDMAVTRGDSVDAYKSLHQTLSLSLGTPPPACTSPQRLFRSPSRRTPTPDLPSSADTPSLLGSQLPRMEGSNIGGQATLCAQPNLGLIVDLGEGGGRKRRRLLDGSFAAGDDEGGASGQSSGVETPDAKHAAQVEGQEQDRGSSGSLGLGSLF